MLNAIAIANTIVRWIGIILVLVAGCPVKCGERIFYLNNVSDFKSEGAPSLVTKNNNFLLFSKWMPFELKKRTNFNRFFFCWHFRHRNVELQLIKNKYLIFKCNLSILFRIGQRAMSIEHWTLNSVPLWIMWWTLCLNYFTYSFIFDCGETVLAQILHWTDAPFVHRYIINQSSIVLCYTEHKQL